MALQRGDISVVHRNPVQGREQAGRRPVLVLSINAINQLSLVVRGVVGTRGEHITRDYPTNVRLAPEETGLSMDRSFQSNGINRLNLNRKRRYIVDLVHIGNF